MKRYTKHWGQKACAVAMALTVCAAHTAWAIGPGETEDSGLSGQETDGAVAQSQSADTQVYTDTQGNVVPGVLAKGITVSKYQNRASESQGGIDWQKAKASGVSFAMVRLGYLNDPDPYYHENMVNAQEAGVKTGVFFYTQALDTATAVEEANFVVSKLGEYTVTYPVAYDLESQYLLDAGLTRQQITDQAIAFCQVIAQAGYQPMIYANQEWLDNHIDTSRLKDESGQPYHIWYARYGTTHQYPNRTIWQCTDSGQVDGIAGNVAIEYAFTDYGALTDSDGWYQVGEGWYGVIDRKYQTGWVQIDGKWYYFDSDGKMVQDTTLNIDGTDWTFGPDGALVE